MTASLVCHQPELIEALQDWEAQSVVFQAHAYRLLSALPLLTDPAHELDNDEVGIVVDDVLGALGQALMELDPRLN